MCYKKRLQYNFRCNHSLIRESFIQRCDSPQKDEKELHQKTSHDGGAQQDIETIRVKRSSNKKAHVHADMSSDHDGIFRQKFPQVDGPSDSIESEGRPKKNPVIEHFSTTGGGDAVKKTSPTESEHTAQSNTSASTVQSPIFDTNQNNKGSNQTSPTEDGFHGQEKDGLVDGLAKKNDDSKENIAQENGIESQDNPAEDEARGDSSTYPCEIELAVIKSSQPENPEFGHLEWIIKTVSSPEEEQWERSTYESKVEMFLRDHGGVRKQNLRKDVCDTIAIDERPAVEVNWNCSFCVQSTPISEHELRGWRTRYNKTELRDLLEWVDNYQDGINIQNWNTSDMRKMMKRTKGGMETHLWESTQDERKAEKLLGLLQDYIREHGASRAKSKADDQLRATTEKILSMNEKLEEVEKAILSNKEHYESVKKMLNDVVSKFQNGCGCCPCSNDNTAQDESLGGSTDPNDQHDGKDALSIRKAKSENETKVAIENSTHEGQNSDAKATTTSQHASEPENTTDSTAAKTEPTPQDGLSTPDKNEEWDSWERAQLQQYYAAQTSSSEKHTNAQGFTTKQEIINGVLHVVQVPVGRSWETPESTICDSQCSCHSENMSLHEILYGERYPAPGDFYNSPGPGEQSVVGDTADWYPLELWYCFLNSTIFRKDPDSYDKPDWDEWKKRVFHGKGRFRTSEPAEKPMSWEKMVKVFTSCWDWYLGWDDQKMTDPGDWNFGNDGFGQSFLPPPEKRYHALRGLKQAELDFEA